MFLDETAETSEDCPNPLLGVAPTYESLWSLAAAVGAMVLLVFFWRIRQALRKPGHL
jgi:hypothetical protein